MISEVSFNGYRFFKDEAVLSFVADRRVKNLLSNSLPLDKRQILKSVALYGGNNSGKTNIVTLLGLLKRLLLGKDKFSFNSPIFSDNPVAAISITYNNRDDLKWLKYEFEYNCATGEFIKEKISSITYYDTGNPRINAILELDREAKVLNVFGKSNADLLDVIVGQKPFLYSVKVEEGVFASLAPYKKSFAALANSIEIVDLNNFPIDRTIEALKSGDEKKREFISAFVKHADLSIDSFEYRHNDFLSLNEAAIREKALENYDKVADALSLTTTYGKASVPSMFFDSAGTKKIEAIASYIYDALSQGSLLVVDEMDNGLHFALTRAIVSMFNNIANTKAQLLFTAHDLLLVDCQPLMRKEQIYFLSRTKEGAHLFCLSDKPTAESGLREGGDLLKHYYKGEFGRIPSPSFISELLSLR